MRKAHTRTRAAMTLIELLTAIAIIGVLIAVGLPAIQATRESARRAQCASNMRQLGIAVHAYVAARQEFPPGVKQWYFNSSVSHRGVPLFAYLLPYMEEANLLRDWDYENPMNNVNQGAQSRTARVFSVFLCPSDAIATNPVRDSQRDWVYGLTSYGGNGGTRSYFPPRATADGVFHTTGEASEPTHYQRPVLPADIRDGLSQTLLFGERSHVDRNYATFVANGWGDDLQQWGWWGASTSRKMIGHVTMSGFVPINYRLRFTYDERSAQSPSAASYADFQYYVETRMCAFGSQHPNGANFCFADGSLRWMGDATTLDILRACCTRAKSDFLERP